MPYKAQQYDAPSNTWLDVVSVTQEIVLGGSDHWSIQFIGDIESTEPLLWGWYLVTLEVSP